MFLLILNDKKDGVILMEEIFKSTKSLKSSAEEVFNGNLDGVVWKDEDGNSIKNVSEYLKTKEEKNRQEAFKKYIPIGSVVSLQGRLYRYIIIGYKYNQDGIVYDYVAAKCPEGITINSNTYIFNHSDISKLYHIGFNDPIQQAYKEKLLEEDGV